RLSHEKDLMVSFKFPENENLSSLDGVQSAKLPASKLFGDTDISPVLGIITVIRPASQYGVGCLQSLTSNNCVHVPSLPHSSIAYQIILCVPIGYTPEASFEYPILSTVLSLNKSIINRHSISLSGVQSSDANWTRFTKPVQLP